MRTCLTLLAAVLFLPVCAGPGSGGDRTSGAESPSGSDAGKTPTDPGKTATVATNDAPTPTLEDARAFYAAQPRHLRPLPYSPTPAGLSDIRSATCGACHQAIYNEWRISTHARAWLDDPQFQEELHKSRRDGDVGWMCVNCHTPLENQLPQLVAGLTDGKLDQPIYVDNPNFDAGHQLDAIGCSTCHVQDGVVLGPWGDTMAPHPVRKEPKLLTTEVCTQCHQAKAHFPSIALACVFDTGTEYEAGPYDDEGKTCQSCHMPHIDRPLLPGGLERPTRRHWFGGSLIAKKPEFSQEIKELEAHYPEGLTFGLGRLPTTLVAGQPAALPLWIENTEAGHMLPTGDPERFLLITADVRDAAGVSLAREQWRIGQVYEWSPQPKKLDDTRLRPRERRELSLTATPTAAGQLTLRVSAEKWRISQESMDYHKLEGRTVPSRSLGEVTATLSVGASSP